MFSRFWTCFIFSFRFGRGSEVRVFWTFIVQVVEQMNKKVDLTRLKQNYQLQESGTFSTKLRRLKKWTLSLKFRNVMKIGFLRPSRTSFQKWTTPISIFSFLAYSKHCFLVSSGAPTWDFVQLSKITFSSSNNWGWKVADFFLQECTKNAAVQLIVILVFYWVLIFRITQS